MRQFTRIVISLVFMCAIPGYALALDSIPAKEDNEKMAADTPDASDTSDASDLPAPKSKKAHKAKAKSKEDDTSTDKESAKLDKDLGELEMQGDNRIKMLLYDEADVYTITTRYGYQTNIVFSPQEEIELISVGDRSLWQIIPAGHRMFIRPMEEDVVTNMTVLTNKHSYQFDLKSLPEGKSGNIYVAQFVYGTPKAPSPVADRPTQAVAAPMPVAPMAQPLPVMPAATPFGVGPSVPVAPAPTYSDAPAVVQPFPSQPAAVAPAATLAPNYSYTYSGADELAPLQVYDDGRSTYLKYPNANKLSADAFIVDPSGKESPVHYSVQGDYLVVDAVTGELALKNNGNVIHVFNEMLNPG